MGYKAKKTEHVGAKRGRGGYWGPKQDAKKESNKIRRRNGKQQVSEDLGSTQVDARAAQGGGRRPGDPCAF